MLKPCWVFIIFSILILHRTTEAREVTNEDIRDAILSLVHMVRSNEDKLERHEYRERQLGEMVKKALAGLEKRHRNIEPIKGTIGRLDERLASVETILLQQDERERIQLQKTTNSIEELRTTVQTFIQTMETVLQSPSPTEPSVSSPKEPSIKKEDMDGIINRQKEISHKVDGLVSKINALENTVSKVYDESVKIKELNENAAKNLNQVEGKLKNSEQLLAKYEYNLAELNDRVPDKKESESTSKDSQDVVSALESIQNEFKSIASDLKTMELRLLQHPTSQEPVLNQNQTLESLQELKYEINAKSEKTAVKINTKLQEMEEKLLRNQQDIQGRVQDVSEMTENVASSVSKSYDTLRNEVLALGKMEKVLVQSADNVMDTKRRIEYGVHQILLEVGDLVKIQGKEISNALNSRFDNIEVTILDNQTGALANLSSKLEQEMSQVWRQIGIMYQELTASTTALDRLQEQTETYVNGSFKIMDSMQGKVTQMNTRMVEVDENMNYLLGRLSLVSQEFNEIRTGLGKALDAARSSFKEIQTKLKETTGPGPHQIDENLSSHETTVP